MAATLKAITFNNLSDNPPTTATVPRTVQFVLTDGHGGTSNTANRLVKIMSVNDAPTVSAGTDGNWTLTNLPASISPAASIADLDSADFSCGSRCPGSVVVTARCLCPLCVSLRQ